MGPKKAVTKKTVLKKKATPEPTEVGSSTTKSVCAVCDQTVVDGKDQALFCEGTGCIAIALVSLHRGSTR